MRRLIVGAVTVAAVASASACGSDGTSSNTKASTDTTTAAIGAEDQAKFAELYDSWGEKLTDSIAPKATAPCATHDEAGVFECNKLVTYWGYALSTIQGSLASLPDFNRWGPMDDAFSAANSTWTTNTCGTPEVYADPKVAAQCDSAVDAGAAAVKEFEAELKEAAGK